MAMPANPPSAPLGSGYAGGSRHQGVDFASGGATIYDGDRLETQDDGILRARLGKFPVVHAAKHARRVHSLSNGYSANLLHGTVVAFLARRADLSIAGSRRDSSSRERARHGSSSHLGECQRTSADQQSWCNSGHLRRRYQDDEPGSSVRMEIKTEEASSSPGPQGAPAHGGHSRAIYFVVVAAAVGTGHRNLARDGEQHTNFPASFEINLNSPKRSAWLRGFVFVTRASLRVIARVIAREFIDFSIPSRSAIVGTQLAALDSGIAPFADGAQQIRHPGGRRRLPRPGAPLSLHCQSLSRGRSCRSPPSPM